MNASTVTSPSTQAPGGMRESSMSARASACFLDAIVVSMLGIIPLIAVWATGAVSFNQQALDQWQAGPPQTDAAFDMLGHDPHFFVTAPLINANLGLVAAILVFYIALTALYYAGSWVRSGATPGQRLLQINVRSNSTGKTLSVGRALLRWATLYGIASAISVGSIATAVSIIHVLDWMTKTPTAWWLTTPYRTANTVLGDALVPIFLVWITNLWSIVLLVTSAAHSRHRGLHDHIAGSLVLSPAAAATSVLQGPRTIECHEKA